MKKQILTEAPRSPLEKMQDANAGRRRQNWGACSDQKLQMYYKICLENNFAIAKNEAESEIKKRDKHTWLAPRAWNIDNLTTQNAQYLWNERKTCHRIIQDAIDLPSRVGDLCRPSEALLRAFVLIAAMDKEAEMSQTISWIVNHMKSQGTYYEFIPTFLQQLMNRAEVPDQIASAVAGVDYTK